MSASASRLLLYWEVHDISSPGDGAAAGRAELVCMEIAVNDRSHQATP